MEDAMDHDATPSATSSSTSSSSQRKRKHGMVAWSRAASMAVLKKRAAKMTKQQHKDKTVSGNHGKAKTLITWLVKEKETRALTTSTDSEYKIKVGTRHYWFNWGKLPVLATGLTCFCESRGRKNAAGILIPESHSTLGKYRSAVSHFRKKAYLEGVRIPLKTMAA